MKKNESKTKKWVANWTIEAHEKKLSGSRHLIHLKAMEIATGLVQSEDLEVDAFSASEGWLDKFMHHYKLSFRATTTTWQKASADYATKLVDFVLFICQIRKGSQYSLDRIYACDETAVWLDIVGKRRVTSTGVRQVAVQSTGHKKLHITVMLQI